MKNKKMKSFQAGSSDKGDSLYNCCLFLIWIKTIGVLLLGSSYMNPSYFEPVMVSGFGVLFIGLLLSFGAMFKKEKGKIKFFAAAAFFLLSFIITWNDPFQIIRIVTWIKN
ncbi:hypothetical protein PH210_23545 [Paenibacillus sp. BSR1-1]|uniref:hypothetical protein n=1 Tax=Paenibacillus sp. BSR1-1 TaxID=3020845 RepID=UPI0025B0F653|nr:hypothetical protein [Paenibacillus sp. BSR1-1]MDN3019151.1 hypothetical protein [Paenibacillus sp. BSR1-1]